MRVFSGIKQIFLALFVLVPIYLEPAIIIFDMDGVLVSRSKVSSFLNIGIKKFLGTYNPFMIYEIQNTFFKFLDLLEPRRPETPKATNQQRLLPQIMCDWLTGEKTNAEIRSIVKQGLEHHKHFFSNKRQKELVAAICEFTFTPERLAGTVRPVNETVQLAHKCLKKRDKWGNKNRIFILSNWDSESFALLYNQPELKKLFSLCNGIVVSGSVHLMKPEPAVYHHLLNQFSVDPTKELTIFIDDALENVQAAKQCGLHAIHCQKLNIKAVKNCLHELGAL